MSDARLADTSVFGALLQGSGSLPASGFTRASDANPLPGVRLDSALENDGTPVYQRCWTVRSVSDNVKSIAVSVVYRERSNATLKEVVLFTAKVNGSRILSQIAAYN